MRDSIRDLPVSTGCIERRRDDSEPEIDDRADEFRDAWRLGMDPIPSLCELLEDKGIPPSRSPAERPSS